MRIGKRLRSRTELHLLAGVSRRHLDRREKIQEPLRREPTRNEEQREDRKQRRFLRERAEHPAGGIQRHAAPPRGSAISKATAPSPRSVPSAKRSGPSRSR